MKRIILLLLLAAHLVPTTAQTMYVSTAQGVDVVRAADAGTMTFANGGQTLTIAGQAYATATIDSITTYPPADMRLVGGDLSLMLQYEKHGLGWLDADGQRIADLLAFLKGKGWNAARVRLFVNPANASAEDKEQGVCQDLDYVKTLGRRIKEAGMAFMLDFHYSDSWADPAKQTKPADWSTMTVSQLTDQLYTYTRDCLKALVAAGATPDLIQTGNEISYGMLWQEGHVNPNADSNWPTFAAYLKSAARACREVCPAARIVIHIERSGNATASTNFFTRIRNYGVPYDVIGLSYYPYFHGRLDVLSSTLSSLSTQFADKKIMIVETGYYHKWQPSDVSVDYSDTFPISHDGQKAFAQALVTTLRAHANVTGLYWWWPEACEHDVKNWTSDHVTSGWYNASLWDNETGRALPALDVLQQFK